MDNHPSLMNRQFGLLTVCGAGTRPAANRSLHSYWICQCACGRLVKVSRPNLVQGRTRSCGVCTRPNYRASQLPLHADALQFAQTCVAR